MAACRRFDRRRGYLCRLRDHDKTTGPLGGPMTTIEQTRKAWARAANFPANKETVYPEHAEVQEFDLNAGKTVLEYGCGGGADALSYLRRQCRVWYVDVVPENVQRATERIH